MSYELFQQGPSVYLPIILLSLIVTLLAYGAVPIIVAITRKKHITKKKYNWICYGINAIVMVLFIAINGEASSGSPYLLWTWVFNFWGTSILRKKGLLDKKSVNNAVATKTTPSVPVSPTTPPTPKKTSATPVKPAAPVSTVSTTDKVGNYGIISNSLANGFTDNARKIIKEQIAKAVAEYGLTRKTDLMKVVFGYVSQEFANAQGPKTDLVVSAYYQIAFDEIVARCGDMNDLIFSYSVSKVSGTISTDIHRYLQMMVKIQMIIDDAIASSQNCDASHGYSKQLQTKVLTELNSYIDDATDWNKL